MILGCVIAHELGHLLLGSNSHSDEGIMQPRWDPNQVRQLMMGTLLFTPEQSKRCTWRRKRDPIGRVWRPRQLAASIVCIASSRCEVEPENSVIPTEAKRSDA